MMKGRTENENIYHAVEFFFLITVNLYDFMFIGINILFIVVIFIHFLKK